MNRAKSGFVHHNDAGQMVRIGRLRLSDGTQTEQTMCR